MEIKDFNGVSYTSIEKMCQAWNINTNTFKERIKRGWDQEKALTLDKTKKGGLTIDGVFYANLKIACAKLGISEMVVRRLHYVHGLPWEECFQEGDHSITTFGVKHKNIKEMSKALNVNVKKVYNRRFLFRDESLEDCINFIKNDEMAD